MTELEAAVGLLQSSPDYRVLRRFRPFQTYVDGASLASEKLGLYVDCETTGLDPETDEIIQLSILPFTFDNAPEGGERIISVRPGYVDYEQPKTPISAEATAVHGISNTMVAGLRFDDVVVNHWLSEKTVALVIAHKADFDRPRIERRFPLSDAASLPWACSLNEVDWARDYGAVAKSLGAALAAVGEFTDDSHDALEDCRVGVHVLATATRTVECARIGGLEECGGPLEAECSECHGTGDIQRTAFNDLLRSARVPTIRLWAAFPRDDAVIGRLKARRYRWNDGTNGKPKAWHRDVKPDQVVGSLVGKLVAQHENVEAVRQAIPATHVKADIPVVAPVVEVWIDKRVAEQ